MVLSRSNAAWPRQSGSLRISARCPDTGHVRVDGGKACWDMQADHAATSLELRRRPGLWSACSTGAPTLLGSLIFVDTPADASSKWSTSCRSANRAARRLVRPRRPFGAAKNLESEKSPNGRVKS